MKIVDYSDIYYKGILKQPVPPCRKGKFVYVVNQATQEIFFIIAPIELSKYHATIVERFCLMNKITGSYTNAKRDDFTIYDSDWQVQGGGFWKRISVKGSIEIYGSSQAYGACDIEELRTQISHLTI